MKRLSNIFYFILGLLSLILGAIGLVLPILPTTPFLLMASFCFIRSSKSMNNWLLNHKIFGAYLRNYIEHKAIKKKDLRAALIFLWLTLLMSMLLSQKLKVVLILILVGCLVSIHLLRLKIID